MGPGATNCGPAVFMPLKLNGKTFTVNAPRPSIEKLRTGLLSCPKDEVFTSEEVMKRFGVGQDTLTRAARDHVSDLTRMFHGKRIWGSLEAIKEFDKMVGK